MPLIVRGVKVIRSDAANGSNTTKSAPSGGGQRVQSLSGSEVVDEKVTFLVVSSSRALCLGIAANHEARSQYPKAIRHILRVAPV